MNSQENLALPVVVSAPAEIDACNAAELRAALAAHGSCPAVVVDMFQTVFCDSAGIRALVQARRQAEAVDGEVRLVITSVSVLRVFALTGADQLFPIFTSLPAALDDGTGPVRHGRCAAWLQVKGERVSGRSGLVQCCLTAGETALGRCSLPSRCRAGLHGGPERAASCCRPPRAGQPSHNRG